MSICTECRLTFTEASAEPCSVDPWGLHHWPQDIFNLGENMPTLKSLDTECPNCESALTLSDFDPEDKSEESGQNICCDECGAEFEDWTWDASAQKLTLDIVSMLPAEEDDEEEEDEEEDDGTDLTELDQESDD